MKKEMTKVKAAMKVVKKGVAKKAVAPAKKKTSVKSKKPSVY